MPSPNGYFDFGTFTGTSRNTFRFQLTYDVNAAPWPPGPDNPDTFDHTWLIEYSTTAVGPWTTATLSSNLADPCAVTPVTNPTPNLGGLGLTTYHVVDYPAIVHDQDYFIRATLFDQDDIQVDQFVSEAPFHTPDYPSVVCAQGITTQTTIRQVYGGIDGQFNTSGFPCLTDTVVWEISTVPGGPYTPVPVEDVTSIASPEHTFTALTPGTQYYIRGRFSEQVDTNGEFLVGPECTATTISVESALCSSATDLLPQSATINGETTEAGEPGDVAHFEWGTTPGGPYPNVTPDVPAQNPQQFSEALTGLTPDTTYYYVLVWERGNVTLDTSEECSFTTPHWCIKGVC